MKLRLHHIEICTSDPVRVEQILRDQFQFRLIGERNTQTCTQAVLQSGQTVFVITSRRSLETENARLLEEPEPWTIFCCNKHESPHIDSVFNIALEVEDLSQALQRLTAMKCRIIRDMTEVSSDQGCVSYAIVESCCGNIVHTLIQKRDYTGWFLPQYNAVAVDPEYPCIEPATTHFDHVSLACHVGETDDIIAWYEKAFEMKRFITNREDSEENGLVINGDVGMRLKVMEFWKCSETGLVTDTSHDEPWEALKIVVVESLPNISNTQVENFLRDHEGPGLQHIGLHTSNIIETVKHMTVNGARFRHPPPAYYTQTGQLEIIKSVGEDVGELQAYGILLDAEADVFDDGPGSRYLMQIFSHPLFERDTFFLEVIQRKGARGFGVGNVTALARSIAAHNESLLQNKSQG